MEKTRHELRKIGQRVGPKVRSPLRQDDEWICRREVRPGPWDRGYRAVATFVGDTITVPARMLADEDEMSSTERVEGVRDAHFHRNTFGIASSW